MPAAVKGNLNGTIANTGDLERMLPEWEKTSRDFQIPACFGKVPQDTMKKFSHTKRVGNYLVGKMINKGSFAKVMEGLHIPTGQKVAMKVIDKKKAKQDSYVLKNMKREPRIHQMIKHPNIVQLYETLETENSYYLVMELCLGGDLMDRICDKKKLEEREVRRYTRQIMSAVEHLHRHGIVHRDLKIENFLLDENNNIKIVDFGLSNTLKFESLSQELLNTQCGSPAYAAPELLAHKKYGPKVDVWSIGVSMFAMLTGTLPFTVEPFNIKQLHQKMVNGEISPIPPDTSSGAAHFMHLLLEPDPVKRPTVKEAMEDKWLNEGFIQKPLNSVTYKNRLRPDELNTIVLNYMTENLELGLSEVINVLINNRPSPVMASYCLLLKKLLKYQREHKTVKKRKPDERHLPSRTVWLELAENNVSVSKHPTQRAIIMEKCDGIQPENINHEAEILRIKQTEQGSPDPVKKSEKKEQTATQNPTFPDAIEEGEIAISLKNSENLQEVSRFAGRELIHLELPRSPHKNPSDQPSLDDQDRLTDPDEPAKAQKPCVQDKQTTALMDNSPSDQQAPKSALSSSGTITPRVLLENKVQDQSPAPQQDARFKDLLKAVGGNIPAPTWRYPEKESPNLGTNEMPQLSPLPRLRQAAFRDILTKKFSWVGPSQQATSGSPPFLVDCSKPPAFSVSRQQTLMARNLRQSKERPRISFTNNRIKRNLIQLKHTHKATDLNLPMLSIPFSTKPEKKSEILRLDFV
ncbi:hormonally up-regulated neu tumor-associated kinase homolog A-like [Rhinatrema bivittatum]|uniref:hormonally up-regulated neu tumor-associated kinase homolog A-like n=1 Tax=Rhinatrema bivittatum TaxID=194408 RepID=UPI00112D29DE|nr:hormonally up-regulated neu tumor-associated kinase homolog A-like [Rhinatrema bivittatum]